MNDAYDSPSAEEEQDHPEVTSREFEMIPEESERYAAPSSYKYEPPTVDLAPVIALFFNGDKHYYEYDVLFKLSDEDFTCMVGEDGNVSPEGLVQAFRKDPNIFRAIGLAQVVSWGIRHDTSFKKELVIQQVDINDMKNEAVTMDEVRCYTTHYPNYVLIAGDRAMLKAVFEYFDAKSPLPRPEKDSEHKI